MLPINYNMLPFAIVEKPNDFYKTNLPEMTTLRSIVDNCKLMLNLPANRVVLEVANEERIYKITWLSPDVNKIVLGWVIYIPQARRMDIYLPTSPALPTIQWKGRKIEFKNYPPIYDRLGFPKLFDRITNLI